MVITQSTFREIQKYNVFLTLANTLKQMKYIHENEIYYRESKFDGSDEGLTSV